MKIYPNNNLLSSIKYRASFKNENIKDSITVKRNKPNFKGNKFFIMLKVLLIH